MKWISAIDRMPVRPNSYQEDCKLFVKHLKTGDKKVVYFGPKSKGRSLLELHPATYAWLDENAVDCYKNGFETAANSIKTKINNIFTNL